MPFQLRNESFRRVRAGRFSHHIGGKAAPRVGSLQRYDHRFPYPCMLREHSLELSQVLFLASTLTAFVLWANEADRPRPQPSRPLAGPVQTLPRRFAERIGHESLGRQSRIIEISPADRLDTQIKLTHHAHG